MEFPENIPPDLDLRWITAADPLLDVSNLVLDLNSARFGPPDPGKSARLDILTAGEPVELMFPAPARRGLAIWEAVRDACWALPVSDDGRFHDVIPSIHRAWHGAVSPLTDQLPYMQGHVGRWVVRALLVDKGRSENASRSAMAKRKSEADQYKPAAEAEWQRIHRGIAAIYTDLKAATPPPAPTPAPTHRRNSWL